MPKFKLNIQKVFPLILVLSALISCDTSRTTTIANPIVNTGFNHAYFINASDIFHCSIEDDGTFSNCADQNAGVNNPAGLVLNSNGNYLYVTSFNDDAIERCTFNSDGSIASCDPYITVGLAEPTGIAITNNDNFLFVANSGNDTIAVCDISVVSPTCSDTGIPGLDSPVSVTLNPDNTRIYATGVISDNMRFCVVNESTGNVDEVGCSLTATGLNNPYAVKVNSSNTYGYVTNQLNNNVLACSIGFNGSFNSCVDSGIATFSHPYGLAFTEDQSQVYVTDTIADKINLCDILSDGTFDSCLDLALPGIVDVREITLK